MATTSDSITLLHEKIATRSSDRSALRAVVEPVLLLLLPDSADQIDYHLPVVEHSCTGLAALCQVEVERGLDSTPSWLEKKGGQPVPK